MVLVGLGIYLGIAYWQKLWPWHPPRQYWGCAKNDKLQNTGLCIQYQKQEDGPYQTEEACESSGFCSQFWGCEVKDGSFTGACVQYPQAVNVDTSNTAPNNAPYKTQSECEDAIRAGKACVMVYGCPQDSNGFIEPNNPTCMAYMINDATKPILTYSNIPQCASATNNCAQSWYCATKGSSHSSWDILHPQASTLPSCKQLAPSLIPIGNNSIKTYTTEKDCLSSPECNG